MNRHEGWRDNTLETLSQSRATFQQEADGEVAYQWQTAEMMDETLSKVSKTLAQAGQEPLGTVAPLSVGS